MRRRHLQDRHIGAHGVREDVEPAVRGEVGGEAVEQDGVVDRERRRQRVGEAGELVRPIGIAGRVGDDEGEAGLGSGARRGRHRDVRRQHRVLQREGALEVRDEPPVVGRHHPGGLRAVVRRTATEGDERVAPLGPVHGVRRHHVGVLRVRLHLVEHHDLDTGSLDLGPDLVDDARTAQAGGHQERAAEAEVTSGCTHHLVCARPEQRSGHRVEVLDREDVETTDVHVTTFPWTARGGGQVGTVSESVLFLRMPERVGPCAARRRRSAAARQCSSQWPSWRA